MSTISEISAIDLVDYEHMRLTQGNPRTIAELIKDAVSKVESTAGFRSIALNEVLIRIGLMELNHFDA